jgi:hypothetical protein
MEAARSHYAGLAWSEDPADAEAYKHESLTWYFTATAR